MRRTALLLVALAACDTERMVDQPRYATYEACETCPGGSIMMTPPDGTVPRSRTAAAPEWEHGVGPLGWVPAIPIRIDRASLARGKNRFDIFCAACHGRLGDGRSQVAENMDRRKPPSLVDSPARDYPPGRIFAAVTDGFGFMPSYAARLSIPDRWAVVAYVQALALSQRVALDQLPPAVRAEAERWLR